MRGDTVVDRASLLRRVQILGALDRVALARLSAYLEARGVEQSDELCREGEPGDCMFIVVSGSFGVYALANGVEKRLTTLTSGDHFGEIALLTDEPRSATVRADTHGEVLELARDRFLQLVGSDAKVGRALATTLAKRLRAVSGHTPLRPSAAGDAHPDVPVTPPPAPAPRRTRSLLIVALGGALAAAVFATDDGPTRFILLLASALALWITAVLPRYVVSLALIAAWTVAGIATPSEALSGFSSPSWVFALSVLGLAVAVSRSGLLLRMGLLLVSRTPPSVRAQAFALMATGIALTPLVPLQLARASLLAPLALSVAETLRLPERGRAAAVIGLAAWIGAGPLSFAFLNGSPVVLLGWALLPDASRARFDWIGWLVAAAPFGALVAGGSLLALLVVLRPGEVERPALDRIGFQLQVLGSPTRAEVAVIAIIAATVALWTIGGDVGLDPAIVAMAGFACAAVATRLDARALASIDWGYLVFYAAVIGLAGIARALGVDVAVGEAIGALLTTLGIGGLAFLVVASLATAALRLALNIEQVVLVLALTLIPTASAVGVEPWTAIVVMLAASGFWAMPAQSPEYELAYSASEGRLYSHGQARLIAIAYLAVVVGAVVLVAPYWDAMGLL